MPITLNPMLTTNAAGSFSVQSNGYVQGMALQESAVRFQLAQGIIAPTETYPMWAGTAITEVLPGVNGLGTSANLGTDSPLGNLIKRATTTGTTGAANITGFAVGNQAHSWLSTPQSPVPSGQPGQSANFYRFGSLAKIPVQCDSALAAALLSSNSGGTNDVALSWDFIAQKLISSESAHAAVAVSSGTVAFSGSTATVTLTMAAAHGLSVGQNFDLSGMLPTAYNGSWVAYTGTTGSTLVFQITGLSASPGAITSGVGQLNAYGGNLPLNVSVIGINVGNSKTIVYSDPLAGGTGNLTWNPSGTVALIQI